MTNISYIGSAAPSLGYNKTEQLHSGTVSMEWKLFLTVFAGTMLSHVISVRVMSIVAGSGFMLIGAWTLYHGLNQVQ